MLQLAPRRLQARAVYTCKRRGFDFVGKLESFRADWARLVELSGCPELGAHALAQARLYKAWHPQTASGVGASTEARGALSSRVGGAAHLGMRARQAMRDALRREPALLLELGATLLPDFVLFNYRCGTGRENRAPVHPA